MDLSGIIPYIPSPVDDNGNVNTSELYRLCVDLAKTGIGGLCVLGSTGEFPYLLLEQKRKIVETAVRAGREMKLPVVAGVTGFSSFQAINEILEFSQLGADAFVLIIESYFPLSEEELANFITRVAKAVPDKPIILYSNPKFMHYKYPIGLFDRLVDVENVIGYKDASGDTGFLLSLVNKFSDRYKIYSASAHIPLFVFELGAVGWMAGPACIIPRPSVRLWELYKDREMEKAMDLQKELWSVNSAFTKHGLTAVIKSVLSHQGYDIGKPIHPLKTLDETVANELYEIVDSINKRYS